MDIVLDDLRYTYAMVYMNDVVFSRTFEDRLVHLRNSLDRMKRAGLTINPKKVQLATSKVDLLGFVVDNGELRPNDVKLTAITEHPCPRDVKSLQRFLGMIAFYRSFIPYCAELSRPLKQLLRKDLKLQRQEAEQQAFEALSRAIAQTAALRIPDLNKPFVLQTDGSYYGLGAVLMQEFDAVLRPVAFASHTLTTGERNYTVTERECLAIMFALKKFDMYLDGASFTIQTDHMALPWLQRLQNRAGRLARWVLAFQRYDLTIQHRRGTQNHVADALLRAPMPSSSDVEVPALVAAVDADARWGTLVSNAELLAAQRADGLCRKFIEHLGSQGAAPTSDSGEFDSYVIAEKGLLVRYIPQEDDEATDAFRAVVARKLRGAFIRYYHDSALAGHSSASKTYEKICRTVTWPGMRQDVLSYAKSCHVCQTAKPRLGASLD